MSLVYYFGFLFHTWDQGSQYRTVPVFQAWLGTVWYGVPSGTPDFSSLNPPKIPEKKKKLG